MASEDVSAENKGIKTASFTKSVNPNTRHCIFLPRVEKKWSWPEAKLAVFFKRDTTGQYHEESFLNHNTNVDSKVPVASLAKTMATLVIFDLIDKGQLSLDQKIPVLPESLCLYDSDFATRKLTPNLKEISIRDALVHANRLSSNPMIYNIAVYVSGTEEKFVALMNQKANDLEMSDTSFVNSHGLPIEGNRKAEHITANNLKKFALAIVPYFDRLKEVSHAPLAYWAEEKPDLNTAKPAKRNFREELRQLGAIFKTATISGCNSLLLMIRSENSFGVSIHLCAPNSEARFQWGKNMITKMQATLQGQKPATASLDLQSSPPAPPLIH